jgi:hypothetical protein
MGGKMPGLGSHNLPGKINGMLFKIIYFQDPNIERKKGTMGSFFGIQTILM